MCSLLSSRFCGDKLVKPIQFGNLTSMGPSELPAEIFKIFKKTLANWDKLGQPLLPQIFAQFVLLNLNKAIDEQFEFLKFSTWLELTVRVFEQSFIGHLTREESFKLFSDLLIRHSLFRPPHSVCVFSVEDVKKLTEFWLDTFDSHYTYYEHCFATKVNNVISLKEAVSRTHPKTEEPSSS